MAEHTETTQFPCRQCGASMTFDPGAGSITCPYCGHEHRIPQSEDDIEELDFRTHLDRLAASEPAHERTTVRCAACGAETTLATDIIADDCPFCGAAVVADAHSASQIRPRSLLPFAVSRDEALGAFRRWVRRLWFAPGELKRYARREISRISGMYVPYWTYDSDTTSYYRGERGEDYWTTEHYTTTVNGKTVHKTRQVRRTRWWPASGVVFNRFNDVLVLAFNALPTRYARRLEPWDLCDLQPYDEQYLAGFRAASYQVGLEDGFQRAVERMDDPIRQSIRRDIGGDHQRIHSVRTQHDDVTFKHLLLPIWISTYRFKEKVYRFLVNARTGEVQGERPWSWVKIALAAAAIIAIILAIVLAANRSRTNTRRHQPVPIQRMYR